MSSLSFKSHKRVVTTRISRWHYKGNTKFKFIRAIIASLTSHPWWIMVGSWVKWLPWCTSRYWPQPITQKSESLLTRQTKKAYIIVEEVISWKQPGRKKTQVVSPCPHRRGKSSCRQYLPLSKVKTKHSASRGWPLVTVADAGRDHKLMWLKSSQLLASERAVKSLSNLNSISFQLFHSRPVDRDHLPSGVDKTSIRPSRITLRLDTGSKLRGSRA